MTADRPSSPEAGARRRWRELARRSRLDTRPLRHSRDFRLLFAGGSISSIGSMITYVAMPYQIAHLTGSYVAVGVIGLIELVPLIVFGLYGGALADAMDRRKLVLVTEVGFTIVSITLCANALLAHPDVRVIYIAAFVIAAGDGLQRPSLDSLIPRIVAADELAAAGALNTLRMNIGTLAGPAVGGILVVTVGVPSAYAVDALSFVASLTALLMMKAVPPAIDAEKPSLRTIADGLGYAWTRKDLLGTYLVDISAMLFAFPYALFPFVAERFSSPWALGLLYTAPYAGSLVATVSSGWANHVHHHGRAIVFAAIGWGAAIALFGLANQLWLALLFLAVAGAADMISGLFRGLMWNLTIPDAFRGRMAGVELLSYSTGPSLGQVRASWMARATSLRTSIVGGGVIAVVAVAGVAVLLPSLWRFDDRVDEHALRALAERHARGDS